MIAYPTYSFIIPHYNIPELLERCLNSIPEREDVEVLVVDDCSPEDCQEKLRQLEQRFPRVTFLSTGKNGGAGRAVPAPVVCKSPDNMISFRRIFRFNYAYLFSRSRLFRYSHP